MHGDSVNATTSPPDDRQRADRLARIELAVNFSGLALGMRGVVRVDEGLGAGARRLIKREVDAAELELEDEPTVEEALYIWKNGLQILQTA